MNHNFGSGSHAFFVNMPRSIRGRKLIFAGDVISEMAIQPTNPP
jgi:hypothetical protein